MSSLTYHAKRCQNKLEEKLRLAKSDKNQETLSFQPSSSGLSSSGPWVFNQRAILVALVEMIIIDELPFRFVEHDGFRRFIVVSCPSFRIPSMKTIRVECFNIFLHSKARLKEFLIESCVSRVSITKETWTSV
ncbi:hypothetical protein LINPERHAP1_LOCUS17641 [Linum perenne]